MKAGGCEKRRRKRLQRRGWAGYIDEGGGRGCLQITQSRSGARPGRGESEHEIKSLAPSHLGENQKRGKQHFQFPPKLAGAPPGCCCSCRRNGPCGNFNRGLPTRLEHQPRIVIIALHAATTCCTFSKLIGRRLNIHWTSCKYDRCFARLVSNTARLLHPSTTRSRCARTTPTTATSNREGRV